MDNLKLSYTKILKTSYKTNRSLPCNELSVFGTLYGTLVNQEQLHRHLIVGLKAKQDHLAFLYKQAKSLKHTSFKQNYPELLFCSKILYCILCFIIQKWAGKHQNSHSQAPLPVSSTSSQASLYVWHSTQSTQSSQTHRWLQKMV